MLKLGEPLPDAGALIPIDHPNPVIRAIGLPMHPFWRTVEDTARGCQINLRIMMPSGFHRTSILDEDKDVGARILAEEPIALYFFGQVTTQVTADGYRLIEGAVGHTDGMGHTIGKYYG